MGIEFNGDVNFNKSAKVDYSKTDLGTVGSTEIGEVLRKKTDLGMLRMDNSNNSSTIAIWKKVIDLDDTAWDDLMKTAGLTIKQPEPTPEQKEAMAKLNEKVSSTDISYGEATKKIQEIREKYNDDKYFTDSLIEFEQPENLYVYRKPIKTKRFDPSKLPEPARTEYREAMEAKAEIENNNTALAKKAGITPAGKKEAPVAGRDAGWLLENLGINTASKPEEPTEKQKAAREKLDDKQASTGMKYKDAKSTLAQLREKYKDTCTSEFESEQPKDGRQIYIMPYTAFDPYKIPEPDKSAYFEALAAVNEVEESNSALLAQAGYSRTEQPSRKYAGLNNSALYQNFEDTV